jgi:long-chain acyl-CoA synthetase
MTVRRAPFLLTAIAVLALPLTAAAIVEPDTETEYPDEVTATVGGQTVTMQVTGVALREKTFLKVDVYTIVSYVDATVELGDDPAATLRTVDAAKRLQMDLCRGVGRDKLMDSFTGVIDDNYDDTSAFAADLETFLAYFQRDAQEDDRIVFEYLPGIGLITSLNGEVRGTIDNPAFVEALWSVWFGRKPADEGMQEDLLAVVAGAME